MKSPLGAASRTIVPGSSPLTRWLEMKPSGVALTVIEICPWSRRGDEVSEYDRQYQCPPSWVAMPTYWLAW